MKAASGSLRCRANSRSASPQDSAAGEVSVIQFPRNSLVNLKREKKIPSYFNSTALPGHDLVGGGRGDVTKKAVLLLVTQARTLLYRIQGHNALDECLSWMSV